MKKGPRQTVFVCSSVKNNSLISSTVDGETVAEAALNFEKSFQVKPESVLGPFYRKKMGILENQTNLKFSKNTINGFYDGWIIKGMILEEPKDCVYVLFESRIDGRKVQKPTATILKLEDIKK